MGSVPTSGLASIVSISAAGVIGKSSGGSAGGNLPGVVKTGKGMAPSSSAPEQGEHTKVGRAASHTGGGPLQSNRAKAVRTTKPKTLPATILARAGIFKKLLGKKLAPVAKAANPQAPAVEGHGPQHPAGLPVLVRAAARSALPGQKAKSAQPLKVKALKEQALEPVVEGTPGRKRSLPLAPAAATRPAKPGGASPKAKPPAPAKSAAEVQPDSPTGPKEARPLAATQLATKQTAGPAAQGRQDVAQPAGKVQSAPSARPMVAEPTEPETSPAQFPLNEAVSVSARQVSLRPATGRSARPASAVRPAGKAAAGEAKPNATSETSSRPGRIIRQIGGQEASLTVQGEPRTGADSSAARADQPARASGSDPSPGASVVNQIAGSVRANAARADRQIVVRLHPPELGEVRLRLRAEGNEIRGVLEVDNPRTLGELQRETPALVQRLAEDGVQLNQQDSSEGFHSLLRDGRDGSEQGAADYSDQAPGENPSPESVAPDEPELTAQVASEAGSESVNVWR
jgi:flagellar hook-length control protein FliK